MRQKKKGEGGGFFVEVLVKYITIQKFGITTLFKLSLKT